MLGSLELITHAIELICQVQKSPIKARFSSEPQRRQTESTSGISLCGLPISAGVMLCLFYRPGFGLMIDVQVPIRGQCEFHMPQRLKLTPRAEVSSCEVTCSCMAKLCIGFCLSIVELGASQASPRNYLYIDKLVSHIRESSL